jgi:hypothetical protein
MKRGNPKTMRVWPKSEKKKNLIRKKKARKAMSIIRLEVEYYRKHPSKRMVCKQRSL